MTVLNRATLGSALAVSICLVQAQAQTVLEGRVEHSASLPPVDPQWKVGKKFAHDKLPAAGPKAISWWRIPEWLAGSWQNFGKIKRLSLKDLENQEKNQGYHTVDIKYPDLEVIGYQQDKSGVVWTCVPTPYVGRTVQGDRINVSIIHSAVPVKVNSNEVVIKFLATTLSIDRAKNKIISVTQRESLQTYRPIDRGKVLVQASMKYFDEDGSARYESTVMSQSRRHDAYVESPYLPAPGDARTLIDMRKSFDNYLHAQHLENLIPERPPLPAVKNYRVIAL